MVAKDHHHARRPITALSFDGGVRACRDSTLANATCL
jgi:hypothetical protein